MFPMVHLSVMNSQQTQTICITFIQWRPNVFDVGPTLYKCYTNGLCLLGWLLGRDIVNVAVMTHIIYIYWEPRLILGLLFISHSFFIWANINLNISPEQKVTLNTN